MAATPLHSATLETALPIPTPPAVRQVFGDVRGKLNGELLALGSDGNGHMLSVEEGGILRCWDAATGLELARQVFGELHQCCALGANGRLLASGNQTITLWDVRHEHPIKQFWPQSTSIAEETTRSISDQSDTTCGWVGVLAFDLAGTQLAAGCEDGVIRIWSLPGDCKPRTLNYHQDEVAALAFDRSGRWLASASEDRTVVLWDLQTGQVRQVLLGHTDRIEALAWTHDGRHLASASWDTSVRIWDVERGEMVAMLNGQGDSVHAITFLAGDEILLCGDSEGVVRAWHWDRLEPVAELQRHRSPVKFLALTENGLHLVSGGGDRGLVFWDLLRREALGDEEQPLTEIRQCTFSSESDLAAVHRDGTMTRWDLATGVPQPVGKGFARICSVAWSDRSLWALGLEDGWISVCPGQKVRSVVCWEAHAAALHLIRFRPDGLQLASCCSLEPVVKLWHPDDGDLQATITLSSAHSIETLQYHPQQPWLAIGAVSWLAGDADGQVALYHLADQRQLWSVATGVSRLLFSPDGTLLVGISQFGNLIIWQTETGHVLQELESPDAPLQTLAMDAHGHIVAAAGDDGVIYLWDRADWRLLGELDVETPINELHFFPDRPELLTANGNATCYAIPLDQFYLADRSDIYCKPY